MTQGVKLISPDPKVLTFLGYTRFLYQVGARYKLILCVQETKLARVLDTIEKLFTVRAVIPICFGSYIPLRM